jgi:hypothetical protein
VLASHYGDVVVNESMCTMQIDARVLLFRSTRLGNPITVIRKRRCTAEDVDAFHRLIGFEPDRPVDEERDH